MSYRRMKKSSKNKNKGQKNTTIQAERKEKIQTEGFFEEGLDERDEEGQLPFNSVLKIYASITHTSYISPWSKDTSYDVSGTGFVIDGHRIITNAHVVAEASFIYVESPEQGKKYTAELLAIAHNCDLALLKINDKNFWKGLNPLKFGPLPRLQDQVSVVGYPQGGFGICVTKGVVSRIEMSAYAYCFQLLAIQIDAAINSGNSGGPVFSDEQQEPLVVGIAFQSLENAENTGYIIPTSVIHSFLEMYDKFGKIEFPNLGIQYQLIQNKSFSDYIGLKEENGVYITRVDKFCNSPLKEGDVLLGIDGNEIYGDGTVSWKKNRISFEHLISLKYVGDKVTLKVFRDKKEENLEQKLCYIPLIVTDTLDATPSYYIYGGFVFCVFSGPFYDDLRQTGDVSFEIKKLLDSGEFRQYEDQEIVVLSRILRHDVNFGYDGLEGEIVNEVNKVKVKNLKHLKELLEQQNESKYTVFTLEGQTLVILDKEEVKKNDEAILKQFGIPSKTNLK